MKRKEGYYWVMLIKNWEIGIYFQDTKDWKLINSELRFYDDEFTKIDEEQITHKSKNTKLDVNTLLSDLDKTVYPD